MRLCPTDAPCCRFSPNVNLLQAHAVMDFTALGHARSYVWEVDQIQGGWAVG